MLVSSAQARELGDRAAPAEHRVSHGLRRSQSVDTAARCTFQKQGHRRSFSEELSSRRVVQKIERSIAIHSSTASPVGSESGSTTPVHIHNETYPEVEPSVSLEELTEKYNRDIPDDYETLDPEIEDIYTENHMRPFQYEKEEIFSSNRWARLKFGRCGITDLLLRSICEKHKKLTEVFLFNCLGIKDPYYLRDCVELRELSLPWCASFSINWLSHIPEGTWPLLRILRLNYTLTTGEMLKGLPPLPELVKLDLADCSWIDAGAVLDLLKHPKLRWVRIDEGIISEDQIRQLEKERKGLQIAVNSRDRFVALEALNDENVMLYKEKTPFFLERFMLEHYPKKEPKPGKEAEPEKRPDFEQCKYEIEECLRYELALRDLAVREPLDNLPACLRANKKLEEHDLPNLSIIMNVLVPILQKAGHLKELDIANMDCFQALLEIVRNPKMLNGIDELNFSSMKLTAIPPSFGRLIFCKVKKLILSNNLIEKLPRVDVEITSKLKKADDASSGRVQLKRIHNFLSNYPSLEVLNLSKNKISSVDEIFPDGMISSESLKKIRCSHNRILFLPREFGFSPYRAAKAVLIDLSNNCIDQVGQNIIDDLESAAPVKIKLNLRDNERLNKNYMPNVIPDNVTLELGQSIKRLDEEEEKKE